MMMAKLIDILARELKVWPMGDSSIVQGSFGQVYICGGGPIILETCRADDWELSEVTRTQWQAAVDALNAESAPAWVGIGLPPVGADVECTFAIEDHKIWHKGVVVHRSFQPEGDEFVVVDTGGISAAYRGDGNCLRPIRTPEQIAAEERDRAIVDMKAVFDSCSGELMPTSNKYLETLFGAIHDAGYRKQK